MTALAEPMVAIRVMSLVPVAAHRKLVLEPPGDWTLADVAAATGLPPESLTISLDGELLERDRWSSVQPRGGQLVVVATRPGFFMPFLALLGAETIGAATALQLAGAALLSIATSYALSRLAAALLAPAESKPDASRPAVRRTIAGANNAFHPYEPLPQVLGRHRIFPPLAARSYSIVEDGKLYQYALFTLGHGPLEISDVKVGDEPVFKEGTAIAYTGIMVANADAWAGKLGEDGEPVNPAIRLEFRQGGGSDAAVTLFSSDIQEQQIGLRLRASKGAVQRTTLDRATRITVLVGCPNGLVWMSDTGKMKETVVKVKVEYRAHGAADGVPWIEVTEREKVVTHPIVGGVKTTKTEWKDRPIVLTGKTRSSVYESRSWDVDEGQYDVRVTRETADSTDQGVVDETHWVSMLITRTGAPVRQSGLCQIAAKIRITGNFTGLVDNLNVIAQTVCPDWDADGGTWVTQATSNPASLYRHVLQGPANKRAVADSSINLAALQAWHGENVTKGFEFNWVTEGRSTVGDVLRAIAGAGRGSPALQDGLFTVVRENPLTGAPVQHFTPRNIRTFEELPRFVRMPEAWKVQFVDPESGYLDTERIVPADGFTEKTASTFERLDMPGITLPDQAYKLGRYHMAVLQLRPADYVVETDFEHLDCVRGDWVKLAHDVILVGLAQGRVVSVTQNGGGDATAVVLDQQCPMAAASYAVRFRKSDGQTVYALVNTSAGYQTTLTFTTPILAAAPQPVAGDLFLFGEAGLESIDMIVKEIEPLDGEGARVTLVDAAAAVLTADETTIPKYDPQITIPPAIQATSLKLPPPTVISITSTDVRDKEGRGPVVDRGLRLRLGPARLRTV